MAVKYQIFVSSTYEDLKGERDQVIKAILEMGHIPVGMEMFSAADEGQWQIIERTIEQSDYYVILIAHRYGSMVDGVSYTEKEYDLAVKLGVPVLGFVIDNAASWPRDLMETDAKALRALNKFKAKVRKKPVGFWSSRDELNGMCGLALMKAFNTNPREGWVRASTSSSPQVTAELSRLSAENADLRRRLEAAEHAVEDEHAAIVQEIIEKIGNIDLELHYRNRPADNWKPGQPMTLLSAFEVLGPMLQVEYSLENISAYLAFSIKIESDENVDIVPFNHVNDMLSSLVTLELVQPSSKKHPVADKSHYWTLSPFGSEVLRQIRLQDLDKRAAKGIEKQLEETLKMQDATEPESTS